MLLNERSASILCRREPRRRSSPSERLRISNAVGETAAGMLHSAIQATTLVTFFPYSERWHTPSLLAQ